MASLLRKLKLYLISFANIIPRTMMRMLKVNCAGGEIHVRRAECIQMYKIVKIRFGKKLREVCEGIHARNADGQQGFRLYHRIPSSQLAFAEKFMQIIIIFANASFLCKRNCRSCHLSRHSRVGLPAESQKQGKHTKNLELISRQL